MDPLTCCLLGICCPPAQQEAQLIALFRSHGNMDEEGATHAASRAMAALSDPLLSPLLAALKKAHHAKKPE